jgi:acyl-CoA thioester hydrolase
MIPAPFDAHRARVQPGWIDHNDHLNMGYYVVAFDLATDAFLDHLGLGPTYKQEAGVATFTLESHVAYLREVRGEAPLRFETRLLAFDAKRIHYFHEMYHAQENYLAATNELLSLHVSRQTRRAAPMAPAIQERLAEVGRRIGLDSPRAG